MIRAQPPQPEQQSNPYTPPGPERLVFEQFRGIETSTTRPGVKDEQAYWLDSMMPIGPRYLRTMYGIGTLLWTVNRDDVAAGATIVFFDFANIGVNPVCIIILSDGSVYAVNTVTTSSAQLGAPGTITNPSRLTTGMTQYGSQYVIIVSQQTNGYFIWDGNVFYKPGDSFGGGTVPTGLGGNSVETYSGRVWVANNATIFFSAPGSIIDFTSGSGGGEFTSSDSFLRVAYSDLRQSNGFLYLIGDSSVNYISGVQTSAGSPPVTTFTNQNADPEVGSPWPSTVDVFGRNIIFANAWGVHVSYGAAVSKISEPLDGIYNSVFNFGGFLPSAAKAIIFGKRCWMLLLPIVDPYSGHQTNKLLLWDSKLWFAATQDVPLTFIQHQELASVLTAWGTDSTSIYPLFQSPTTAVTKVAMSKLWDAPVGYETIKTVTRLFGLCQFFTPVSDTIEVRIDNEINGQLYTVPTTTPSLTWTNSNDDPILWTNNLSETITWSASANAISVFDPIAVGQQGVLSGMTFTTACPDMALISMKIQDEIAAWRG